MNVTYNFMFIKERNNLRIDVYKFSNNKNYSFFLFIMIIKVSTTKIINKRF